MLEGTYIVLLPRDISCHCCAHTQYSSSEQGLAPKPCCYVGVIHMSTAAAAAAAQPLLLPAV